MKTNVMRILDQKKIRYVIHTYQNAVSGIEVADTLNESYDKVFKTLVTVSNTNNHYVFVVPVNKELDLKKAAKVVNEKKYRYVKVSTFASTYRIYSWRMFTSWNEKTI
mgnify:CR=1 FL=1